ncbi:2-alkenal reductase (NADP(+)-dependent) [Artemisia annua]|uniref:2-alkenal reductase (NADP(+)-dependent) n=1 Tax=Artemisia annua TaxID=35608 RepID=A0A2U1M0T9_ARTAN|nr:2-alkenal reductase (NADP(+)-dependent) [Artemisia annua]
MTSNHHHNSHPPHPNHHHHHKCRSNKYYTMSYQRTLLNAHRTPKGGRSLGHERAMASLSASVVNISKIIPGNAINGCGGLGRVVASKHPDFHKNDIVYGSGSLNWAEYTIVKGGNMLRKVDKLEFPLSYHVGIFGNSLSSLVVQVLDHCMRFALGSSGLTAYGGFFQVCKPKKGDKVFVSAVAGSVGNLVCQYAKLCGCYAVGCAGSNQKVELLKGKLGLDDAFNYKKEADFNSALQRYFPDGIDIYFDNVGGKMLEVVIANMNSFGRIAICGDLMLMTIAYVRAGKLFVLEDISLGIESIPSAFVRLFRGENVGKQIV